MHYNYVILSITTTKKKLRGMTNKNKNALIINIVFNLQHGHVGLVTLVATLASPLNNLANFQF